MMHEPRKNLRLCIIKKETCTTNNLHSNTVSFVNDYELLLKIMTSYGKI